jgi:hypothetical protein
MSRQAYVGPGSTSAFPGPAYHLPWPSYIVYGRNSRYRAGILPNLASPGRDTQFLGPIRPIPAGPRSSNTAGLQRSSSAPAGPPLSNPGWAGVSAQGSFPASPRPTGCRTSAGSRSSRRCVVGLSRPPMGRISRRVGLVLLRLGQVARWTRGAFDWVNRVQGSGVVSPAAGQCGARLWRGRRRTIRPG